MAHGQSLPASRRGKGGGGVFPIRLKVHCTMHRQTGPPAPLRIPEDDCDMHPPPLCNYSSTSGLIGKSYIRADWQKLHQASAQQRGLPGRLWHLQMALVTRWPFTAGGDLGSLLWQCCFQLRCLLSEVNHHLRQGLQLAGSGCLIKCKWQTPSARA